MKRIKGFIVLLVALSLSGCGSSMKFGDLKTTQLQSPDGSITTSYAPGEKSQIDAANAQAECRKWVKEREEKKMVAIQSIPENDRPFVMMHAETMEMVVKVFSKTDQDVCRPGTNMWDAYIAEVQAKNDTLKYIGGKAVDGLTSIAPIGFAAWLGGKAVDAAGTKISLSNGSSLSGSLNDSVAGGDGTFYNYGTNDTTFDQQVQQETDGSFSGEDFDLSTDQNNSTTDTK